MSALAGTLILLFAGDRSPDLDRVVETALAPRYDSCGAVFDAAQAARMFELPERARNIKLQRLSVNAQRRWLHHPVPYRHYHAALLLFDLVDDWEEQFGPVVERDPANAGRIEEAKAEKFAEIYACDRHELKHEALQCLERSLGKLDFRFQLEVGEALVRHGGVATVAAAIERWVEMSDEEFPKFSLRPLLSQIEKTREGHKIIEEWLHKSNECLRFVSVALFLNQADNARVLCPRRLQIAAPL